VIEGEDFSIGHRVRDGEVFPTPTPSKNYDVAIIGGGVSGLSTAYELRDTNFLLNREGKQGGRTREAKLLGGHLLLRGAAYFAEPEGEIEDFYSEISLPLKEVPKPVNSIFTGRKLVLDIWDEGINKLPFGNKAIMGFKKFKKGLALFRQKGRKKRPCGL